MIFGAFKSRYVGPLRADKLGRYKKKFILNFVCGVWGWYFLIIRKTQMPGLIQKQELSLG